MKILKENYKSFFFHMKERNELELPLLDDETKFRVYSLFSELGLDSSYYSFFEKKTFKFRLYEILSRCRSKEEKLSFLKSFFLLLEKEIVPLLRNEKPDVYEIYLDHTWRSIFFSLYDYEFTISELYDLFSFLKERESFSFLKNESFFDLFYFHESRLIEFFLLVDSVKTDDSDFVRDFFQFLKEKIETQKIDQNQILNFLFAFSERESLINFFLFQIEKFKVLDQIETEIDFDEINSLFDSLKVFQMFSKSLKEIDFSLIIRLSSLEVRKNSSINFFDFDPDSQSKILQKSFQAYKIDESVYRIFEESIKKKFSLQKEDFRFLSNLDSLTKKKVSFLQSQELRLIFLSFLKFFDRNSMIDLSRIRFRIPQMYDLSKSILEFSLSENRRSIQINIKKINYSAFEEDKKLFEKIRLYLSSSIELMIIFLSLCLKRNKFLEIKIDSDSVFNKDEKSSKTEKVEKKLFSIFNDELSLFRKDVSSSKKLSDAEKALRYLMFRDDTLLSSSLKRKIFEKFISANKDDELKLSSSERRFKRLNKMIF